MLSLILGVFLILAFVHHLWTLARYRREAQKEGMPPMQARFVEEACFRPIGFVMFAVGALSVWNYFAT